ncbi:5-formyltetrahydrofolate cyclo-ligase [Paracoccus sp. (in: a-proteobacteria)]|uniref:5-formyltetrahydrofolate cyclo-ligase n=1 Tax=Paracoccus sp. TaxID=267 RepID=UPI0026E0C15A|nr:5-formyltetrahydrofolate cyclo-ligase [Paracoccus sp. (in: a-proteobacteria)]MDO5647262.1 5-formyltetrahydrofolate cyclo-ligase [Paracoccus sp. (in: a-proteobacteria)]
MKRDLRARALAARQRGGDADALTTRLIAALSPHHGRALAGYWPMRGEADPCPAMAVHNGPLCLPVVTGRAVPLIFRAWDGGDLQPGPFGTQHPDDSAPALRPDVLIVPLVGFDRAGNRLGYGGGYYDRTLELLRKSGPVVAIGLAWAVQELARVPTDAFDQPLDLIVTDRDILTPLR